MYINSRGLQNKSKDFIKKRKFVFSFFSLLSDGYVALFCLSIKHQDKIFFVILQSYAENSVFFLFLYETIPFAASVQTLPECPGVAGVFDSCDGVPPKREVNGSRGRHDTDEVCTEFNNGEAWRLYRSDPCQSLAAGYDSSSLCPGRQ